MIITTPSAGIERLRTVESAAYRAGIALLSMGWDARLGLHATVADLHDLAKLLHVLNEDVGEIKMYGEVGSPRYRTTTMLDGVEFVVHCGAGS